jgi:alpha-1,3/alpha-1,6-mannosyltransferase
MGLCESFNLQHITRQDFTSSFTMPQETDVLFLLSIPTTWKEFLLRESSLLLYTPEREHFGIVPLEALLAGVCFIDFLRVENTNNPV